MVFWVRSKCVGKGSFGSVSLAVDKFDGRVFAVKSVEQSVGLSSQIECLENEIRILRSLSSPYVVGFLGDDVSFESPTTSYRNMHMEYLQGGTVADSVDGGAGCGGTSSYFDEKVLRSRTWCVVSALSYIHSRGVVHCDVKGRNILVGADRNSVKLADFGSAIAFPGDGSGPSVVPRGSPLWMAPEVIRGESQGPNSDIWSLGCTVIEMITGKPAWDDCGADTLSRIGYSEALPKFPSRLSEIGRDFLEKCLHRDPTQRWSSDQLLQHPFLASASPETAVESSPRCVLDWVNADFEDDEDDEETNFINSESQINEVSVEIRLGKLRTSVWPNWESDGWSAVRSSADESEASGSGSCRACRDDEEEEDDGIRSEYSYLNRLEAETEGTSSEYSKFEEDSHGITSSEHSNPGAIEFPERPNNYLNCEFKCGDGGGGEAAEGGSSGRRGPERREIITITSCLHSMKLILHYWKILMRQLILFTNYILLPFISASNRLYYNSPTYNY